ncbi:MAG: PDZ domain-containing protein [Gammaproteobacteria bacterium]|jgi:S1-C subfamily serine protease
MKTKKLLPIVFSLLAVSATAQEANWNSTLERISSAVVSIRIDSPRAFDTERNVSSQATGFVVDAEQGLILTNRHVVTPGPVRAQAIFLNQEEVDLQPIYRDPVHDFGFFRYDPSDLQFMEPVELPLAPESAQIGRDIRVVGNDAGEQLSILAGTIARLDRRAPNYGVGRYNDFNTFYLQAASGTSGGSSGSPVINIDGQVVALNAGANTQAASSFFLPLDRIRVALERIRLGQPVQRGTLQTEFVHTPYAELRRLGLHRDTEAEMRAAFPERTGLLVVERVLPGSPAADVLRPGDILLAVGDRLIAGFVPLAELMDSHVGRPLRVVVERGGQRIEHALSVTDLESITPREYVEFGDGVFHELSYQQARHFYRPVSGVYVANPGYVFGTAAIPRASLITQFDGKTINSLDDFEAALTEIEREAQVRVRFVTIDDPGTERQRILNNYSDWYRSVRCHRDDSNGDWPCRDVALNTRVARPDPQETSFPPEREPHLQQIVPSLVLVNYSMPYTVSGVSDRYYYGTGLIVDQERGWVIVDRNTVPVAMGDVRITFAGSVEIPGSVEYIHPLHNLAVVSYDPALIGDTPVREARFADAAFETGDEVAVVGLGPDHEVRSQWSRVASLGPVNLPLSRTLRFRDSNLEAVSLVNGPTDFDGVIVDAEGRALAVWASFAYQAGRDTTQINMGIPAELVGDMVDAMQRGRALRSVEVEWQASPLASARKLDLPEEWARRYEAHNPLRRQILSVGSTVAGSSASRALRTGDLLLSIDGTLANSFREAERATQKASVEVVFFRDGEEISETIETVALDGFGIERAVNWAGALLQAPHRALAVQRGLSLEGVYVSFYNFGSPASRAGLLAGRRISAVNGVPTPNLDRFVEVVRELGDVESVRLEAVSFNNVPEVITLEPDEQYWPAHELRRVGSEWQRLPLGL